jgi:hypothetical protein
MRGKDFNTGLRGTLFEAKQHERMSSALWLYGWLILRQTRQDGTTGWVLGGKPISYSEIQEETGFPPRTLERWMRVLREEDYIETRTAPGGIIVQITRAKKFWRGTEVRNFAEGPRRNAEARTNNCGNDPMQTDEIIEPRPRISSGYLIREEKDRGKDSCLRKARTDRPRYLGGASADDTQYPQGREASIVWRNLKQEFVKRELKVGEGPQVRRRVTEAEEDESA